MAISNSLLIALMFATILTLGIANLLMALAGVVGRIVGPKEYSIHTAWKVLLFFVHLVIFWHTGAVVSVEGWGFPGFLYIIGGPIVLFFATSILLSGGSPEEKDPHDLYFEISSRFFQLFGLLQLWIVGADVILGRGFTGSGALNAILAVLAFVLAMNKTEGFHKIGVGLGWGLVIIAPVLRWLGIII